MGTMQHHVAVAVVHAYDEATTGAAKVADALRLEADAIGNGVPYETEPSLASLIVGPVPTIVNGGVTYLMAPDGSKEWWDTSNLADQLRDRFVAEMRPYAEVFVASWGDLGARIEVED